MGIVDVGFPRSPLDSKFMGSQRSKNIITIGGQYKGGIDGTNASFFIYFLNIFRITVWGTPEVLRGIKTTLLIQYWSAI